MYTHTYTHSSGNVVDFIRLFGQLLGPNMRMNAQWSLIDYS